MHSTPSAGGPHGQHGQPSLPNHPHRASGVLLHPSSLPGPFGSGDFGADAYRFVDWLASAGQRLWQVLPLGELGPGNSPYMSQSAFAGNLLLIDLQELADHGWLGPEDVVSDVGNDPSRCDFERVKPFRHERLRRASRRFAATATASQARDFAAFCALEQAWLDDYAVFMAIDNDAAAPAAGDPSAGWTAWPGGLARREPQALRQAIAEHADEVGFWKFCQWRFTRQWARLRHHAKQRGVSIIGDMPIFVAYHSADVWAHPELFELDSQGRPLVVAGVPPDYFSVTGQLWGNPLYRWESHRTSGYAWWIARLRQALQQADLVRIDHFRGFVACWEIPAADATAERGRWVDGPGARLFEAFQHALRTPDGPLPIIAEDLGEITPEVTALRQRFGLPGMRVLQFAFGDTAETADNPFLPHCFDANTVAYTGTHDNDTSLGWWTNASARERAFAQHYLGSDGRAIHWDMIRALSASVADRVIYPLQDVLGLSSDQRMNLPGEASGNWAWRFSWDQLHPGYAQTLAQMSAVHGRCPLERAHLPV